MNFDVWILPKIIACVLVSLGLILPALIPLGFIVGLFI
jgi:hypothetical protein